MAKVSKKSKRRLLFFGPIAFFTIAYFSITLVGYLLNYASLKENEKELNAELKNLKSEKATLKTDIIKLNDPEYVARYAKENYLYSKDGEYVIKIDNPKVKEEEKIKGSNYVVYITIASSLVLLFLIKKKK